MNHPAFPHSIPVYPLLAAVAAVAVFLWLLYQIMTPRRQDWLTAVVVPAVLAGGALFVVRPAIDSFLTTNPRMVFLGLAAALAAGLLFDLASSPRPREEIQVRTPAPLLLWATAMLLFVASPVFGQSAGPGPAGDRWVGAMVTVAASVLLGQALAWAGRFSLPQPTSNVAGQPGPAAGLWRLVSGIAGTAAVQLAVWMILT